MVGIFRTAVSGAFLACMTAVPSYAIVIQGTDTADTLAQQLFLNADNITIIDAQLTGGEFFDFGEGEGDFDGGFGNPNAQQAGTYLNVGGTYGLPSPGIVLSTGDVLDYASGPNTSGGLTGGSSTIASGAQNDLLSGITGQVQHFDPIQLDIEFNVDAGVEEISFIGVFGSEEFPEFVGSSFIDGFGLFVNGQNVAGALETGAAPGSTPLPINVNHPDFANIPGTELDGVIAPNNIPLLRFDVPVQEGLNNFTVILADASDDVLDTTVYLSSFGDFTNTNGASEFTPILPSNPPDADGTFVIEIDAATEGPTIWIDPPVSVGFTYEANNAEFASVTAPSLLTVNDPDGYELVIGTDVYTLLAGQTFDIFGTLGFSVSEFDLRGIEPTLGLDPADGAAFPLGVSLLNITGPVTVDMTPITVDDGTGGGGTGGGGGGGVTPVPIPGAGLLYLIGLVGFGGLVRRKQSRAA